MAYRKIRPSSFGDSSTSPGGPSEPTSESAPSTGSDPRRLRGEKYSEGASTFKRRRVPDSVTRNACLNCKKARSKCDGKRPCTRCAGRNEECVYEVHIKHAKEELVKQVKEYRAKYHVTVQILKALSNKDQEPEILSRLKNGESYESIVDWLGRRSLEDNEVLSPRDSQHSAYDQSDHEMKGVQSMLPRWSSVTADSAVLDHLFQLYFAWVHPVHTLFNEGHFVKSYNGYSDDFCSSFLVNAICAMACHLHSTSEMDDVDYEQLSQDFSAAARENIDPDDKKITSIQALAVMFLVGCADSNMLRAVAYLKIATDNLSAIDTSESGKDDQREVLRDTVHGISNLNGEWAQITFKVPPRIEIQTFGGMESSDRGLDQAKWYCYRFMNADCPSRPGYIATINREKSKLVSIIVAVTTMMYTQHGAKLSAQNVLEQYSRFTTWRQGLPKEIRPTKAESLPYVLSMLILYETAVIHLLRPLLDLEGFQHHLVEENIWKHAQNGLSILEEYNRTAFTCRYQPVSQMFAVLHLTDIIARFFPGGVEGSSKDGPEAINFGLQALAQSRLGFAVAGPLQEMLRRTAVECSIRVTVDLDDPLAETREPPREVYQTDDFLDACTRSTYVSKVSQVHSRYLPTFSADWGAEGASLGFQEPSPSIKRSRMPSAEERGAQSLMQIRNLLNDC